MLSDVTREAPQQILYLFWMTSSVRYFWMEVLNVDCQDIDFPYTFTNAIGSKNTSLGDKSEIPKSQIKEKK